MAKDAREQTESDLPHDLAKPAQRALVAAGLLRLDQIAQRSESELRQLHGMGPKALEQLRHALHARDLSFADKQHG